MRRAQVPADLPTVRAGTWLILRVPWLSEFHGMKVGHRRISWYRDLADLGGMTTLRKVNRLEQGHYGGRASTVSKPMILMSTIDESSYMKQTGAVCEMFITRSSS